MNWLLGNWDQVLVALGEHLVIVSSSLAIAFAIAMPIGIWAARSERVFRISLAISGFLYTIPTLAFLALLIPVVGPREGQRDPVHGGVLADDPDSQCRHRTARRIA